jgi:hypothetical protein
MALIDNKEIGLTDYLTLLSISKVTASKVCFKYLSSNNRALNVFQ